MKYFETSAKVNLNVNETFTTLTKEILNISDNKKSQSGTVEIKKQIDNGKSEKKQCCK